MTLLTGVVWASWGLSHSGVGWDSLTLHSASHGLCHKTSSGLCDATWRTNRSCRLWEVTSTVLTTHFCDSLTLAAHRTSPPLWNTCQPSLTAFSLYTALPLGSYIGRFLTILLSLTSTYFVTLLLYQMHVHSTLTCTIWRLILCSLHLEHYTCLYILYFSLHFWRISLSATFLLWVHSIAKCWNNLFSLLSLDLTTGRGGLPYRWGGDFLP